MLITADLPAFAKPGQRLDITVSALGKAKSLRGGTLVLAPLYGADGQIYAMAQGNLVIGGLRVEGADGSKLSVNIPSAGRIGGGANVERAVDTGFTAQDHLLFNLHQFDATNAGRLADAIDGLFGQGKLTVRVEEAPRIVQPAPFSKGQTAVEQATDISVEQEQNPAFMIERGTSLSAILDAINRIRVPPGDLVAILEALSQAGALTGGNLGPVMHAVPHEMPIIGGAGIGSLIIGNSSRKLKALGTGLGKVFKGPQFKKQDYLDCIFLVSKLMKMLHTDGPVAVEPHIENPAESALFTEYPKLLKDQTLVHLICDTLRLVVVSSGTLNPHAVEEVMDNSIKNHHHHTAKPAEGLQGLADALPALGIVAAVLGVVKTMGSIDKPPEVLGGMIGSALVGTFLGVLLAYGLVGPFANRAKQIIESDAAIYQTVKQIIIASLHGHPQPLVIEAARSGIEHSNQPSFAEVFDGMRGR